MAAQTGTAAELIPDGATLDVLRREAADCKACELWTRATQTVFGEGAKAAAVMLIGEQPGDAEDRAGKPFVGPAGKLLDRALAEAGIDRKQAYVTNAVKHFNWSETRGKKRIHKKPNARQMAACKPWLEAEIHLLRPRVIVLLGATAAQQLLGPGFSVMKEHGRLIKSELAPSVVATVHPSSILRAPDDQSREAAMREFVEDLRKVAPLLQETPVTSRPS
ncbi:MAG TPA: UdgX family uracil-DNA binding protein [Dehalococcoidia bacterium]|jgi:DNA polymerase|nr:UdgX family uracil-DNA binding protein [Dehalococcoidia bacterium]